MSKPLSRTRIGKARRDANQHTKKLRILFDKASAAYETDHFERCVSFSKSYLRIKPYHLQTVLMLSTSLYKLERLEEAEPHLKRLIDAEPECVEIVRTMAMCVLLQAQKNPERLDDAVHWLKRVLYEDPDHIFAHAELAQIYSDREQYRAAEFHLLCNVEANLENSMVHAQYGSWLYARRRHEEAEKYLRTALKLDVTNFKTALILINLYLETDQAFKAYQLARGTLIYFGDCPTPESKKLKEQFLAIIQNLMQSYDGMDLERPFLPFH